MKCKMLKEKIREKRIMNESCNVLMKAIGKIRVNFGDLYI